MYYNIEHTLTFFPYVCLAVLAIVLLLLEIKDKKGISENNDYAINVGGFTPPSGYGYQYYVENNGSSIVYIFQKSEKKYRIYLIQGNVPNIPLKQDKYGQYFTLQCENTYAVEAMVDNMFSTFPVTVN